MRMICNSRICFRTILLIVILSINFSCQEDQENSFLIIDTQASKSLPCFLSEIFALDTMVELKTKDSLLLGRIDDVYKTKDFILINEYGSLGKRLLRFDNSGDYLKSIGRNGHGPGEYTSFSGIAIDTSKRRIVIASAQGYLVYDFEGKFVQSFLGFQDCADESMAFVKDQLWIILYKPLIESEKGKFMEQRILFKLDNHFNIIDSIIVRQVKLSRKLFCYGGIGKYFSTLRTGIYLYCPVISPEPVLRDTLFKIDGSEFVPAMKLDFSQILSVKEDTYGDANYKDYLERYVWEIRNVTIDYIYRTARYVFAEYGYMQNYYLFCYDLGRISPYNMLQGFTDDLCGTNSIVRLIPLDLDKGEFCFVKYGYELKGKIEGMDEDSNPVVFFIKTKE